MKIQKITFVLFLFTLIINAQKEISSSFLTDKIKMDGELNELVWKNSLTDGNFIQSSPNNGQKESQKTRIAVLNDAAYFYVAAEIYLNSNGNITQPVNKKLTQRDDTGTSDYFGVIIDPFGASREGWAFLITAANVQTDIKVTENGNYGEWNAIWESAVKIYKDKWTVELKIPFNSLRFPKGNFENFTINFEKFDAYTNENSFWNHIDEDKNGVLNQFGKLNNLKNINAPINLAFNPFVALVQEKTAIGDVKTTFSGGLDLKYVYKNAYTLDLSLIPDFSQAPSDNEILNLSPFDIKHNENRQFFVEGTELFDKGNYLYTRRIGGEPIHKNSIEINDNERIIENPVSTNIVNLIKFTGKMDNGLSVGILNGITKKSEAKVFDSVTGNTRIVTTNPLTNYNAIVLDKTLKNNSSITLLNNSVIRSGHDFDSNLTAGLIKLYDKNRKYSLALETGISQQFYSKLILEIHKNNKKIGNKYKVSFKKISGKIKGGLLFSLLDDDFNNNDFGYHQRNNYINYGTYVVFAQTKPKHLFSYYHLVGLLFQHDNFTEKTSEKTDIEMEFYAKLKNNHNIYAETSFSTNRNDFYESRVKNRKFKQPNKLKNFVEYQTNENKDLSFKGYATLTNYFNSKIYTNAIETGYGIDYRLGNHLVLEWDQSFYSIPNSLGFLTKVSNDIIFGQRKIKQLENKFRLNYAINSKIYLTANVRHYWIQVAYKNQFTLLENGNLATNNYTINTSQSNANFNTFNVDFLAKWQFAPASELSLAYKLKSNNYNQDVDSNYPVNLNTSIREKTDQTLSLKFTYLIDFNKVKLLKSKF